MKKRIHSFGELKEAIPKANLEEGLACLEKGDCESAVQSFDSVGDLTSLQQLVKEKIKEAYCVCGKCLQVQGRLKEARSRFERARETDCNDILLLSRIKLLQGYTPYRSAKNIGEFRKVLKEGFTEGKYGEHPYPFLAIAEKYNLVQQPSEPLREQGLLRSFRSIGVYRAKYQGSHLLSELIRRYKYSAHPDLAHPFAWLIADIIRYRTELLAHIDMIVPLPSNPNKQVDRGFTPCLLIADELSKCLAVPYFELFIVAPMDCRFRGMSYDEGKKLIRYRKGQPHTVPSGKSVLLLDDVATSGRTLSLHADALRESGAREIHALTLAKTGPPVE